MRPDVPEESHSGLASPSFVISVPDSIYLCNAKFDECKSILIDLHLKFTMTREKANFSVSLS